MTKFQELISTLEPTVQKVMRWCVEVDNMREIDMARMVRDVSKEEHAGFFLDLAMDILRPAPSEHFLRYLFDGTLHSSIEPGTEDRAVLERVGFLEPDGAILPTVRDHFAAKARLYFQD